MSQRLTQFILIAFTCLLFASPAIYAQQQQWRPVSGQRQMNISGLALVEWDERGASFIIVHDNKKPEQPHAALVRAEADKAPQYVALEWRQGKAIGEPPVDLEAITTVPEQSNNFMAFDTRGNVYQLRLDAARKEVEVLKVFRVPVVTAGSDFEGFALQRINNKLLAVWADRGLDAKPATLFWSVLDLRSYTFGETNSIAITVPTMEKNVRHISDVKVDLSGATFITSASDPGNDGPFDSAFFLAGAFHVCEGKIIFIPCASPLRLLHFEYHKVEGFDFIPGKKGGIAFGTDDENLGSALLVER